MKTTIRLSDHFSYRRLIRFTWPSMMMMIISSVYGMVDGVMVSNFVGTTPFAALNLIWPYCAVLGSLGFMIGSGGSALVAKTLGRKQTERANDLFSMLTYTTVGVSVVMGIMGLLTVRQVAVLLGAEGEMIDLCVTYGSVLLYVMPFYALQIYFQSFLITAERPKMGLWVTIGAGVMNMLLDVLFIGVFGWGLEGAAWATAASLVVGGGVPLVYFIANKGLNITLGRYRRDLRALLAACYNGVSEFAMQISLSLVSTLYMYQLMRAAGENGVAAYGIMMYFSFVFVAIFIGFGIGSAPVVSYHYGAQNCDELGSLLRKSIRITAVLGVAIAAVAQLLARPLSAFFVGYDPDLFQYTVHAFRIYTLMILVAGFNIFASAFFTALNNGLISAIISLTRTIILEAACVLILPLIFGIESIWWSVTVAEGIALVVSLILLKKYQPRYGY